MCFAGGMCAVRGKRVSYGGIVFCWGNVCREGVSCSAGGNCVQQKGRVRQRQNVHNLLSIKKL